MLCTVHSLDCALTLYTPTVHVHVDCDSCCLDLYNILIIVEGEYYTSIHFHCVGLLDRRLAVNKKISIPNSATSKSMITTLRYRYVQYISQRSKLYLNHIKDYFGRNCTYCSDLYCVY